MDELARSAHPRITRDPNICHGQPVGRGLRYPVWCVLEWLASGMSEAEILAEYEDLEAEDLRACQAYAAALLKKFARTLGQLEEEREPGRPVGPLTKQQFLDHLIATGKVPPGTTLKSS